MVVRRVESQVFVVKQGNRGDGPGRPIAYFTNKEKAREYCDELQGHGEKVVMGRIVLDIPRRELPGAHICSDGEMSWFMWSKPSEANSVSISGNITTVGLTRQDAFNAWKPLERKKRLGAVSDLESDDGTLD